MRSPEIPNLLVVAAQPAMAQANTAGEIALTTHEGEVRILDTNLAEQLGFAKPAKIRELIARHRVALGSLGVLPTVGTTHAANGRTFDAYYLNKKQAIFITAKSETDRATEITLKLIERFDAYERGLITAPAAPSLRRPQNLSREAAVAFRAFRGIAKLIGLDENQAALSAARATKRQTGIDPLEEMGVRSLIAPQQDAALTPSDLGVRLGGKSSIQVNQLLSERGLQDGHRDAKGHRYWLPTEAGRPYAVMLDTGKQHTDGTPVRQLKWTASVIDLLVDGGAA